MGGSVQNGLQPTNSLTLWLSSAMPFLVWSNLKTFLVVSFLVGQCEFKIQANFSPGQTWANNDPAVAHIHRRDNVLQLRQGKEAVEAAIFNYGGLSCNISMYL
jgi:hypothetical protein